MDLFYNKGVTWLYNLDLEQKKLVFKNVAKPSETQEIDLGKFLGSHAIESYTNINVHQWDSVFILSSEDQIVYLLNSGGEILQEIKCYPIDSISSVNYSVIAIHNVPVLYHDQRVYLIKPYTDIALNTPENRRNYFSRPSQLVCSATDSTTYSTGSFPEAYRNGDFYYDFYPSRCINNNGEMVYSFGADHNLYVYKNDSVRAGVHECKSKYVNSFNTFAQDKIDDLAYQREYRIKEPRYVKLIYDKYRNVYYRIVKHPAEFLNKEGTIVKASEVNWSIMIINQNFEVIKEIEFDAKEYSSAWIYPVPEGVYISQNFDRGIKENKIAVSLFKIVL